MITKDHDMWFGTEWIEVFIFLDGKVTYGREGAWSAFFTMSMVFSKSEALVCV